ncbi:phage tail protein [Lactococcus lactis]|uniref:Tape measure protein N-terminal domain-containing protein n=1 Tax=Lactococcus lactis subsp. lactis TaxID=1360 RepID=A0A2N5W9U3_LACLL|nr:tape measure protein [Lactococcus lactis]PLW59006.1 putative protein in mcp 3'region [Lactococcus lactis subsp. lactis]
MAGNAKFEVEIYGNTVQFENSLKGINSAMSSLKGEANQLRKELRFDPTNVTAMTKLQDNYKQQLEQTKNKATALKKELAGLDSSTPDGQKKFIQLSKAIQDSELKANYLERDIKQLDSSISSGNFKVDLKTDDAESKLSRVKKGFSGMKEIAIGAFREIGANITNALGNKMGDWINDTKATQKATIALKNTMDFSGVGGDFESLSKRMGQVAKDTNANTEDALKLASTFIGLGDNAQTAGDKVENIIKANQAFGGSGEQLQGVVQAYGQMSASGKVTAENINQLTDNNTALGSALKKTVMEMNPALKQYGSFAGASEAGAISVGMLDSAMQKLGKAGGGGVETIDDSFASLDETISLALLPALDAITPVVTDIVNSIADSIPSIASALGNIVTYLKENWDWISKILIAIAGFIAVVAIILTIQKAVMAVATAFAFLTSPIGLVILAIGAFIAIGVLIWQNWSTISSYAQSIWGGIKDFFAGLGTWFGELWTGILSFFSSVWQGMLTVVTTIWDGIKAYFSTLIEFYSGIFNAIVTVVSTVFTAIGNFALTAFNAIVSFFSPLGSVIGAIFDLVIAVFQLGWELIKALARGAWQGIQAIWSGLVGFFSPIWNAVSNVVNIVFTAIGNFARSAWSVIVSVFSVVAGFFSGIFNSVRGVVSGVFSAFGSFASGAWGAIRGVFSGVAGWFGGIFNGIKGTISGVFNAFGSIAQSGYNAITGVFSGIGSFFSGIFNGVKNTVDSVLGGISGTIKGITDTINGITGKVKGLFKGSTVTVAREFADLKSRGLVQNSASSSTANYQNTFNIQAGSQDTTALARAIKREFDLGRA